MGSDEDEGEEEDGFVYSGDLGGFQLRPDGFVYYGDLGVSNIVLMDSCTAGI